MRSQTSFRLMGHCQPPSQEMSELYMSNTIAGLPAASIIHNKLSTATKLIIKCVSNVYMKHIAALGLPTFVIGLELAESSKVSPKKSCSCTCSSLGTTFGKDTNRGKNVMLKVFKCEKLEKRQTMLNAKRQEHLSYPAVFTL